MGADTSRIYSPSEDEDGFYSRSFRRGLVGGRKETTTTTIDVGFAIRARKTSAGGNGVVKNVLSGEINILRRMVS